MEFDLDPEQTAEELIMGMTDEELLGLTPPQSRPATGNKNLRTGSKPGLGALVPASALKPNGSRPPSGGVQDDPNKPRQARLAQSASAPTVGALRPASVAEVKAQRKEKFHFKRQRRWLEVRNKQHCLSFTEQEIMDFQRFFDALAKGKDTIRLDRFEDMLVCLDLAKSRKDIREYMEAIKDNVVNSQITFDDFLKSFETNLDTGTMDVLKLLLQGSYDSRDLDYPTFISERRRELILSATGARGQQAQGSSIQVVRTFSDLLEDRCYHDFGQGSSAKGEDGVLLMGGLGTMWQVACVQHGLDRMKTADERMANFKKSVPLSPRTVIQSIVKASSQRTLGTHRMGSTLVIEADRITA